MTVMKGEGRFRIIYGPATIVHGTEQYEGYHARPDDGDPGPAVLLIPGIWGLTSHLRDLARRFARQGYYTLVPDLLGNYTPFPDDSVEEARAKAGTVADDEFLHDLSSAFQYLRSIPWVDPDAIAAVGFSAGGRLALLLGAREPQLGAVAAFYAPVAPEPSRKRPVRPLDVADRIQCPVLGFYGAADPEIPVDDVRAIEAAIPGSAFLAYPDVGHGWFNDHHEEYVHAVAQDAWNRLLAFLGAAFDAVQEVA